MTEVNIKLKQINLLHRHVFDSQKWEILRGICLSFFIHNKLKFHFNDSVIVVFSTGSKRKQAY